MIKSSELVGLGSTKGTVHTIKQYTGSSEVLHIKSNSTQIVQRVLYLHPQYTAVKRVLYMQSNSTQAVQTLQLLLYNITVNTASTVQSTVLVLYNITVNTAITVHYYS